MAQEIKLMGFFLCSVPYCLILIWSRYFIFLLGEQRSPWKRDGCWSLWGCSWMMLQDCSVGNVNPFRKAAGRAFLSNLKLLFSKTLRETALRTFFSVVQCFTSVNTQKKPPPKTLTNKSPPQTVTR